MQAIKIISGEAKGPGAEMVRLLLRAASLFFYAPITRLRNILYDKGYLKSQALPVPVICVGNITTGGTGKTPMTIWLCRHLQSQGKKLALLTRGYKAHDAEDNDEIKLIRQSLPELPIVINPDRVKGGLEAIEKYQPDVIVMDDGFQHRRLRRDLDIVMIDAANPFGYDALLPRGLLRESLNGLKRAGALILSRSDAITPQQLNKLKNRLQSILQDNSTAKEIPVICSTHTPTALIKGDQTESDLAELAGKKGYAFCGIGNPDSFATTLRGLNAQIVGHRYFPDHAAYNENTLAELIAQSQKATCDYLMTTEKDWVKLKQLPTVTECDNLYWLKIELTLTEGRDRLYQLLNDVC